MATITSNTEDKIGFGAAESEESSSFLSDYLALCEKHGLFLSSYHNGPSFHDPLVVIPMDQQARDYLIHRTLVFFEEYLDE